MDITAPLASAIKRRPLYLFIVISLILAGASILAPFNHDEDQYYAASYALSKGMIYRDFIFLQTPISAHVGHALTSLWPGQSLWVLRISQSLIGSLIFALVLWENLRRNARPGVAILCALLMITCYSFLFATTVYRNDMLPSLLSAAGIIVLCTQVDRSGESGRPHSFCAFFLGGFLLALATSAKANFLPLCLAPVPALLSNNRIRASDRLALLIALGAGGIVGTLPIFGYWLLQPDKFAWQVVHFGSYAPLDWYNQVGQGDRLKPSGRARDAVLILVQGPALAAIALLCFCSIKQRSRDLKDERSRLLDWFIIAGLVAALLPNPTWRQYFVAPLPALFMRLPILLEHMQPKARRVTTNLLMLFGCVGVIAWSVLALKTISQPSRSILTRWSESRWIGEEMQKNDMGRSLATLSPHLAVDSGQDINLRFVSGVFVYRWGGKGRDDQILAMGGVTPINLESVLLAQPPAAIVTGYESGDGNAFSVDFEAPLAAFARDHGYVMKHSPFGKARLYLRQRSPMLAKHVSKGDKVDTGPISPQI